jgi:dTDP-glucose 4,6-dehydratase
MASLLVTGGAGFIGSNFVRYWRRAHPADRLIVYDLLTYAGYLPSIADLIGPGNATFIQGDICDEDRVHAVMCEQDIDTVVHFAAESHVDRSILGPRAFVDTNVSGTHSLLMAARRAWIEGQRVPGHRFHHISTDEVYGSLGPQDAAFTERTPYAPNSPYSASKASSDFLVRAYHHTYGLSTTITNCSNNYGPYQFPEKLIPLFILNCLRGKPLPIYGDGMNVRDWLHVVDHCRAIDLVLKTGKPGATYNVGGESELPNLLLIDRVCDLVDDAFRGDAVLRERFPDCPAAIGTSARELKTFVTDRPGHDRRYAIDMTRIREDLGFTLSVDWTAGLADTVRWYLDNQAWWQGVLAREHRS